MSKQLLDTLSSADDFWYASAGLVRIQIHVVGVATDDQGNLTGRVVIESDQVLTDFDLVGAGLPRAIAGGAAPEEAAGGE